MKILVIGLDCAAPEILLQDPELVHFRHLMEAGCYGRLESVIPPITVPAWMCMATSQDPGSLGVYGFRNRADHSYDNLQIVNARSIRQLAIWDQVAREGKRAHIIGVPPNYPARKTSGISLGCFLTPDSHHEGFSYPAEEAQTVHDLVGDYPVDVRGFRTDNKQWLREEIYTMTRKHFEVIRHVMRTTAWDYLQFVEIGLDRIQHGFWKYHDPQHRQHQPGNPWQTVVRDYYRYLDQEVGQLLELLDDDTTVLVLSDHGAQRLDGGFCINQWLIEQGLLVLHHYPDQITPFDQLDVDWCRTRAWSEGGYYARIFLNVRGREPHGVIDPAEYESFREELRARIAAVPNDRGEPMQTRIQTPEQAYRAVRGIAPDLIVHFDDLYWRSIGSVGHPTLHVQENDTGPDDCNHAQYGAFILAGSRNPLTGPQEGVHLLDLAPTLLEMGHYDVPDTMQGRSLVSQLVGAVQGDKLPADEQDIIRQRLSGLGYI